LRRAQHQNHFKSITDPKSVYRHITKVMTLCSHELTP
jgi:hypothetical protein